MMTETIEVKEEKRCSCDFCTRKKLYSDNWCSYCADVKMLPPKHWENCDVCDECEQLIKILKDKENE